MIFSAAELERVRHEPIEATDGPGQNGTSGSSYPASTSGSRAYNENDTEGITQPTQTDSVPVIDCCNGMFDCADEAEARWVSTHTGSRRIGTNTVDDFYSLFGERV